LRYVKNAEIEGKFFMERDMLAEAERKAREEAERLREEAEAYEVQKRTEAEALAEAKDDPFVLFERAVQVIEKYTDASASYVATIEHPEGPPGELEEGEPESEDEEPPPAPPEEGEGDGAEEQPPEPEPAANQKPGEEPKPNIIKFRYDNCFLRYVAATEGDRETIRKRGVLTRPPPPTDDDEGDEAAKPPPLPPTFRMLDEQVPSFYLSNVADEPAVQFFKRFPRMGSYFAAAVQSLDGEFKALVCADNLVPSGSGRPFSQQDRDFVWDVSRALTKALTDRDAAREASREARPQEAVFAEIKEQVTKTLYPPPPEEGEGVAEAAPADAAAEGEEGEEVEEEPPAEEEDDIARCQRELRNLEKHLVVEERHASEAAAAVEVREVVRRLWATQISAVAAAAAAELGQMTHAPRSTFRVLRALVHILREDASLWASWPAARTQATEGFFERAVGIDAAAERDMDAWGAARRELKACAEDQLPLECPETNIGALLRKYIRSIRATANKAVIMREKEAARVAREEEIRAKKEELEAAEKQKAEEEEEAARLQAEQEAAEREAEEGAEGEEEEEDA